MNAPPPDPGTVGKGALCDVALPPLRIGREASGLQLVAIERCGVPLFHARLSLPAGAAADPAGKEGLAAFTAELLRRGTRRRSAHGLEDLIEGMGSHLGIETTADETALGLTVPLELAAAALDALLEVALEPAFDDGEADRARRRTLAGLQADLDEPSTVAGRAMIGLGYGPGHPYGHPADGFARSVETFSRADALAFHAARYRPEGAALAVCGSAPVAELEALARAALARAPFPAGEAAPAQLIGPAPQGGTLRALVVHKPDATQAQVRIVSSGLSRRDPGWAAAALANTALGGGFTSILVDAIRVDRGLSYSVASRLSMNRHAGLSIFASFTKNETLRELCDVALAQMRRYAERGPAPEALEKVKRYLAGLFPFALEGHQALAEQLADAVLDGMGLTRLQTYRSALLAASLEQARAAAARLSPARQGAQLVVVGDGDAAQRALAGLCPVEVVPLERFG